MFFRDQTHSNLLRLHWPLTSVCPPKRRRQPVKLVVGIVVIKCDGIISILLL